MDSYRFVRLLPVVSAALLLLCATATRAQVAGVSRQRIPEGVRRAPRRPLRRFAAVVLRSRRRGDPFTYVSGTMESMGSIIVREPQVCMQMTPRLRMVSAGCKILAKCANSRTEN
jgi:hypothetical protein